MQVYELIEWLSRMPKDAEIIFRNSYWESQTDDDDFYVEEEFDIEYVEEKIRKNEVVLTGTKRD